MMEEEVEVAFAISSTWNAVEGCLKGSISVVNENDEVGTPGATSRVVLVPPSVESGPCELTVSFRQRLCHVRQLYVLSSARTVEIYGQLEQDTEAEYVSTVRGEQVSLPENEILKNVNSDDQRIFSGYSKKPGGEISACEPPVLASSVETKSKIKREDVHGITLSAETGELFGQQKEHLLTGSGTSCGRSRDSERESVRSLSDGVPEKMVQGSIIFDEPLDQTDWVQCPHSPMKSCALSSDDEVDINKCGFLLVDSDGEAQRKESPRTSLFVERINIFPDHALRSPPEAGEKPASRRTSTQSLPGKEVAAAVKEGVASECCGLSKDEPESAQNQYFEEPSKPPTVSSAEDVIESCVLNDKFSELGRVPDGQSPGVHCGIPSEMSSGACRTGVKDSTGTVPGYQVEVSLHGSDAWRSVKIRLLSLKHKSKLVLHKVIINLVPGPSISPLTETSGPFGSFQPSAGSSSLLAMFAPGIFQMARGLADSRRISSLGLAPGDKKSRESEVSPSLDSTSASLSVLHSGIPSPQPTPSRAAASSFGETGGGRESPFFGKEDVTSLTREIRSNGSHSSQVEPWRTRIAFGKESGVTVIRDDEPPFGFDQSEVESKLLENIESEAAENVGRAKHDDLSHEVVQRLDRLEAICLRMEDSLNLALENMDRRLKLLEIGGMGRIPDSEQPFTGTGYEAGRFGSAASVNVPPVQRGMMSGSVLDKQTHSGNSAPVDSPARLLPKDGIAPKSHPFYPGLLSSTSPSLLSSVSPALPLWPFSSPKHVPLESNRCDSGISASVESKNVHMDQLIVSGQGEAASLKTKETYWEARSDDRGSGMCSEHTSSADSSEEPDPSSCPESVSSSPFKPQQQMENALASTFSSFLASFDAPVMNSSHQKDPFQAEDADSREGGSFTSEEQAPLVDVGCISRRAEDEGAQVEREEIIMQSSEAISLSTEKRSYGVNVDELRDVFWASEVERPDNGSQIYWYDGLFEGQEGKTCSPEKKWEKNVGKHSIASEATPELLLDTSGVLCMDDLTTYDLFPTEFERILREEPRTQTKVRESSREPKQEKLPNPFFQEVACAGEGDVLGREDSLCEEFTDKQLGSGNNVTLTYMTVRGFVKPLDPHKERLLQEELFPEDWKWFTSLVSPSSDDVNVPESVLGNGGPGDPPKVYNENSERSVGHNESRSLLDEDVTLVGCNGQFRVDICSKDWDGQKAQWSLLDDDPRILSYVDFQLEEGQTDDWFGQNEQRSLLDEDIFIPSRNITTGSNEGSLNSPCISPEEQYDLSGVIMPPKCTDTVRSPSSHTSGSIPFEDDRKESADLKLENQNLPTRDLLQDFDEEPHEFEAPDSERTQSLLFHLSL